MRINTSLYVQGLLSQVRLKRKAFHLDNSFLYLEESVVLTAAHCITDRRYVRKEIIVIAGTLQNVDIERFRGGQMRYVLNDAIHPKWERDAGKKASGRYYDVGLLFLEEVSYLRVLSNFFGALNFFWNF